MFKLVVFVLISVALHHARGEEMTKEQLQQAHDAFYSGKEMVLTPKQKAGAKSRVAIASLTNRWTNNTIPYIIDGSRQDLANQIRAAAEHIRVKTNNCIKIVPHSGQRNYVRVFRGGGCYSTLGMWGGGLQDLSLGNGCEPFGTIVHEFLHAVGLDHQQNRPDRDNYINVYRQNVISGQEHNFDKTPGGQTFGTSFDWQSVMLYGEYAFSRDRNRLKTMEDRNHRYTLTEPYTKTQMTDTDAYEVKRFYQCP